MAEKQITINQLAKMIKKGFDNTPTKGQFETLENDVKSLDKNVKSIEKRLGVVERDVRDIKNTLEGSNGLETRVEYIENILAIKK